MPISLCPLHLPVQNNATATATASASASATATTTATTTAAATATTAAAATTTTTSVLRPSALNPKCLEFKVTLNFQAKNP